MARGRSPESCSDSDHSKSDRSMSDSSRSRSKSACISMPLSRGGRSPSRSVSGCSDAEPEVPHRSSERDPEGFWGGDNDCSGNGHMNFSSRCYSSSERGPEVDPHASEACRVGSDRSDGSLSPRSEPKGYIAEPSRNHINDGATQACLYEDEADPEACELSFLKNMRTRFGLSTDPKSTGPGVQTGRPPVSSRGWPRFLGRSKKPAAVQEITTDSKPQAEEGEHSSSDTQQDAAGVHAGPQAKDPSSSDHSWSDGELREESEHSDQEPAERKSASNAVPYETSAEQKSRNSQRSSSRPSRGKGDNEEQMSRHSQRSSSRPSRGKGDNEEPPSHNSQRSSSRPSRGKGADEEPLPQNSQRSSSRPSGRKGADEEHLSRNSQRSSKQSSGRKSDDEDVPQRGVTNSSSTTGGVRVSARNSAGTNGTSGGSALNSRNSRGQDSSSRGGVGANSRNSHGQNSSPGERNSHNARQSQYRTEDSDTEVQSEGGHWVKRRNEESAPRSAQKGSPPLSAHGPAAPQQQGRSASNEVSSGETQIVSERMKEDLATKHVTLNTEKPDEVRSIVWTFASGDGAEVKYVTDEAPAEWGLEPGDLLISINEQRVGGYKKEQIERLWKDAQRQSQYFRIALHRTILRD